MAPVHFVGIGGIGMSALARILLQQGVRVSGSSDRPNAQTEELAREGATVAIGHHASNIDGAPTVVVSSAIGADNPELVAARERGLTVLKRGTLLARLMEERRGIAIAGTHGKTTTTAMTAMVVEAGGFDPAVALGGIRLDSNTNARNGDGAWFVAESDESDRSFLELAPEIAVLTNIENDHIDSDAEIEGLVAAFEMFLSRLPKNGLALVNVDEARAARLAPLPRSARTRTFGFAESDVRALAPTFAGFESRTPIVIEGVPAGELHLNVPGRINVANALAAIGIGLELGMPFAAIAAALATFRGVARRFEFVARTDRMVVIDDYAHHPTAVSETIAAARSAFEGPIVVVFQPHRYTRTRYLADAPIAGVDAGSITRPLRALGADVEHVPDVAATPAHVLRTVPSGSLVLFLGAGSISSAAHALGRELSGAALAS